MISVKKVYYSYNDIFLIPKCTSLKSRSEASTNVKLGKFDLSIPFISANMDTITGPQMAMALWNIGAVGALHRFNDTKNAVSDYLEVVDNSGHHDGDCIVSIGVNKDYQNRAKALYSAGATVFLVDVAHGHSIQVKDTLKWLKTTFSDSITIIAGNVVTADMTQELVMNGADIVKVGIGPGSVCTTRLQTGVGYPQLSAVIECADAAHGLGAHIIADGGCTCPGDVAKAFGAGGDFVMLGGMFAGHEEGGGKKIKKNGSQFIEFYGSSSDTALDKHYGGLSNYRSSEGKKVQLKYRGKIKDTVLNILGGIRSSCTYVGAPSLKQLSKCTTFIRVNKQFNDTFE